MRIHFFLLQIQPSGEVGGSSNQAFSHRYNRYLVETSSSGLGGEQGAKLWISLCTYYSRWCHVNDSGVPQALQPQSRILARAAPKTSLQMSMAFKNQVVVTKRFANENSREPTALRDGNHPGSIFIDLLVLGIHDKMLLEISKKVLSFFSSRAHQISLSLSLFSSFSFLICPTRGVREAQSQIQGS